MNARCVVVPKILLKTDVTSSSLSNLTFTFTILCSTVPTMSSSSLGSSSRKLASLSLSTGQVDIQATLSRSGSRSVLGNQSLASLLNSPEIRLRQVEEAQRLVDKVELAETRVEIRTDSRLGEGAHGMVYEGILDRHTPVAVKVLRVDTRSFTERYKLAFLREADLHFRERLEYFVQLYGIVCKKEMPCLVLQKMQCSLHFLISSPSVWEQLPVTYKISGLLSIAKGMHSLHERPQPVMHRDLKTPNILLVSTSRDADLVAKVCDFGVSINSSSAALGRKVDCPRTSAHASLPRECSLVV